MLRPFFSHPASRTILIFGSGLLLIALALVITGPILIALAISMMLYAALSPSVDSMIRQGLKASTAVFLTMLVVVMILIFIIALIFPLITGQIDELSSRMDSIDQNLLDVLFQLGQWTRELAGVQLDPSSVTQSLLSEVSNQANQLVSSMMIYFNDVAFSLVLIPVCVFFLLRDFRQLRNETLQLLPNRYFELGWLVYNGASAQLQNYVRGLSIQAFAIAVICSAGYYVVGIDFAPLLGITVALLNLIPFFGISLAKIPPVIVVLLSDNPDFIMAMLAIGVVYLAQAIDTAYLLPNVVAKSANLHPLTVMLSVALAGYYYGFFGLVLIVPILFSMKVIFNELLKGLGSMHSEVV